MRTIVIGLLLSISAFAQADVLDVNIWKSMPGKAPLTFQYGAEARAIHQDLGADVIIGADTDGRMHYVLTFENWAEWAKFGAKAQASEEVAAFFTNANQNPSAQLEDNYLLNVAAPGGDGSVYQVFIWQPELGRGGDLFEAATEAKAIHEKRGASVGILFDQLNRMHYLMGFESWDAWAKFQDTPNEEFAEFMQKQNQDPTARLVKVYTANNL